MNTVIADICPDTDDSGLVVYPEVEDPTVALIEVLIKRNNLFKKVALECQSSD